MRKICFTLFCLIISLTLFAQKRVARYYVGGLLYCTHTYYINSEHSETSYLNVTNTQNYKGSKYTSCATCRYDNKYGVTVMNFQDQNLDDAFSLYIRYIDKQNCILVFKSANNDDDKIEIYAAKEVVSDK